MPTSLQSTNAHVKKSALIPSEPADNAGSTDFRTTFGGLSEESKVDFARREEVTHDGQPE